MSLRAASSDDLASHLVPFLVVTLCTGFLRHGTGGRSLLAAAKRRSAKRLRLVQRCPGPAKPRQLMSLD